MDYSWERDSNVYRCDCGAIVRNHSTYLWSNQHGFAKRVFCDSCGQWTDIEYTDRHGWSKKVRREAQSVKDAV